MGLKWHNYVTFPKKVDQENRTSAGFELDSQVVI
jgi:hypothetical protein